MTNKNSNVRSHDDFYLKEKKFQKKPKYLTQIVYKILQKKNFKSLIDIGCGNGDFLRYIAEKIPNKVYIGTDIHKKLINLNKKKYDKMKFFYDDIKIRNSKIKSDIVHCAGVINIFDDVENFLKNIISRCCVKGHIYIIHYFNEYNMDYIVRYRNNNEKNNNKIIEQGWNVFSIHTISKILKKNKKVRKFTFEEIKFPKKINVKKNKNDLCRSWTINFDNTKYFINGLRFLNKIYILKIELK